MSDPNPHITAKPPAAAANATPPAAAITTTPPAAAATATVAPPKPAAAPPKPAPPKPPAKAPTRRDVFLTWINVAWIALTASLVAMLLGTVRFLFPNVLSEPPSTFRAGTPSDFDPAKVEDRFKPVGAWVIKDRDDRGQMIMYALSTTCTHLGCTPNWLEAEKKFKCPCHGSGFKITGVNFEGPAPRPLERYAVRLSDEGQIIVDKSRKFQKELGQWSDVDSYILVG
jgi:cytochrome b6-f complex iron-sulfur subunit